MLDVGIVGHREVLHLMKFHGGEVVAEGLQGDVIPPAELGSAVVRLWLMDPAAPSHWRP